MKNTDEVREFWEQMADANETGLKKKMACVAKWAERSPYATADLRYLMEGLHVRTFGDKQSGGLKKAELACAWGDLAEGNGTCRHPLVYLASSSDVAFALSLRHRSVYLVDPDFVAGATSYDEINEVLGFFGGVAVEEQGDGGRIYRCQIDFGYGKEDVTVTCVPLAAADFRLPQVPELGGIISYQSGGNAHPMMFPELCSKIVCAGLIFSNEPYIVEALAARRSGLSHWHGEGELSEEVCNRWRDQVRDIAGKFGFHPVLSLDGVHVPYYMCLYDSDGDFIRAMCLAVSDKLDQDRRDAEDLGLLKMVPMGTLLPSDTEK